MPSPASSSLSWLRNRLFGFSSESEQIVARLEFVLLRYSCSQGKNAFPPSRHAIERFFIDPAFWSSHTEPELYETCCVYHRCRPDKVTRTHPTHSFNDRLSVLTSTR